ncbi:phage tail tip fiber protein [Paracoccus beibuensis]|uniref:phage tail tip fiber protein n=1 Tax=Paracoccus beibuensis TaxID=547602 RepID=UPI00223FF6B3|nr:hypothetical protein [Paracoccus beibuensis]
MGRSCCTVFRAFAHVFQSFLIALVEQPEQSEQHALFIEANVDGTNQIIAAANRFAVATGTGPAATRRIPFLIDNGQVYMDIAFIKDLSVDTIKITNSAVTKFAEALNCNGVVTDNTSSTVLVVRSDWTADTRHLVTARVEYQPRASDGGAVNIEPYIELVKDGTRILQIRRPQIPNDATSSSHGTLYQYDLPLEWYDAGNYSLQFRFTTTGLSARLGGRITTARWVR